MIETTDRAQGLKKEMIETTDRAQGLKKEIIQSHQVKQSKNLLGLRKNLMIKKDPLTKVDLQRKKINLEINFHL